MSEQQAIERFIHRVPKAELHLHIEGTLEPELMFEFADRNGVRLRYASIDEVRRAYQFSDLQSFLDIYYEGTNVLQTERDFYDLTMAYLRRAAAQNVRHAEVFFDPQAHTTRGVAFGAVVSGIHAALEAGQHALGVSSRLILCFLRHLSQLDAMETLKRALPYRHMIAAVGLDSSERENPPSKFKEVFARARAEGFLAVAHAGEEGPAAYVREALDQLGVVRIDHGVRVLEDPDLVAELAARQVPLTVCPLSNVKLRVFEEMSRHPLRQLMTAGLLVTINSDDPAYFGGYVEENYLAVQRAFALTRAEIARFAANSFRASFLSWEDKTRHIAEVEAAATAQA